MQTTTARTKSESTGIGGRDVARIYNRLHNPLVIPAGRGKSLYLGPLEIRQVADSVLDEPLVRRNIELGRLHVLTEPKAQTVAVQVEKPANEPERTSGRRNK